MKVRITLMTENDRHITNASKAAVEDLARKAWEAFCILQSGKGEKATVESIEVIEQ